MVCRSTHHFLSCSECKVVFVQTREIRISYEKSKTNIHNHVVVRKVGEWQVQDDRYGKRIFYTFGHLLACLEEVEV